MVKTSTRTLLALVTSLTLICAAPTQAGSPKSDLNTLLRAYSDYMESGVTKKKYRSKLVYTFDLAKQVIECEQAPKSQQLNCFEKTARRAAEYLQQLDHYGLFRVNFRPDPDITPKGDFCAAIRIKCIPLN
jgi:hypothetical protein